MLENNEYKEIDELISSYVSGEATAEQLKRMTDICRSSETLRKYTHEKLEIWFKSGEMTEPSFYNGDLAYQRFLKRTRPISNKTNHQSRSLGWYVYRIAAIFIIVLLPLAGYWQGKQTGVNNVTYTAVEVPMGATTKLVLPDGSCVWLNADSKLTYSSNFGNSDRNIQLDGEGYFEVAHNENLPFRINTEELSLQVLGTKFNFKNYKDEGEAFVNLIEGRVALYNQLNEKDDICVLTKGQMARLNKTTGDISQSVSSGVNSTLWMKDELFFDDVTLEVIAKTLSRAYNQQIETVDSVKSMRFYGSFNRKENSLFDALSLLCETKQINFRFSGGKYIIY